MAHLEIQRPPWLETKQPLLYELAGHPTLPAKKGVLQGESASIELPPDQFSRITLFLPDNSRLVASLCLNPDGAFVPVAFSATNPASTRVAKSRNTDPSWQRAVASPMGACFRSPCSLQFHPRHTSHYSATAASISTGMIARLWRFQHDASGAGWRLVSRSEHHELLAQNQPATDIAFALPPDTLYLVQYGHELIGVQNTVVPPGAFSIQLEEASHGSNRDVVFDIDLRNSAAESLVTFLQTGQSDRADVLAESILKENTVFTDSFDPVAAIVGSYYFLAAQHYDRLTSWTSVLDQYLTGIPDTAVIRGWQCLQSTTARLADARDCFSAAIDQGLPIFTSGVRLLVEGVHMLKALAMAPDNLARLDRYVTNISSLQPYTTFASIDPNAPALVGNPEEFRRLRTSGELI